MIHQARLAAALGSVALVTAGGTAPQSDVLENLDAAQAPLLQPLPFDFESLVGKSSEWKDVAVALWKRGDDRSLTVLQALLGDSNWDRQRAIGQAILNQCESGVSYSLGAQRTLTLARAAVALELAGNFEITWGSGLTFTAQLEGSSSTKQTQVSITPHIKNELVDRSFKPITLWPDINGGATLLVETFSDRDFLQGASKGTLALHVQFTAQNQELEGPTVQREFQRSAKLDEDGQLVSLPVKPSAVEEDLGRIQDLLDANRISEARSIQHALVQKEFPALAFVDPSGVRYVSDAAFFGQHRLTVIKASFVGCRPCELAEPKMEELGKIPGVQSVTLVVQTTREKTLQQTVIGHRREIEGKGLSHPWFVTTSNDAAALGVRGYPSYFILDSRGTVLEAREAGAVSPESLTSLLNNQTRK